MAVTCKISRASPGVCARLVREDLAQTGPGRGRLFLAWTKSCGTRYLVRVKVAGLSRDHVEGARLRKRQGTRRNGERGAANLLAPRLRAAHADVRRLLARLHEPVCVRRTCGAQASTLGHKRGGVAGQAAVRAQIRSSSTVCAHWGLERQKRRQRPVKRRSRSQSHAGGPQTTCCPFQSKLSSGASSGPAPEFARRATNEDVLAAGVQHPVAPLARVIVVTRYLYETLIKTQVVPDGVLPALSVLSVVGKGVHDEFVDAVEREPPLRALADGHHDERVITEGRFFHLNTSIGHSGFVAFAFAGSSILACFCSSALLWVPPLADLLWMSGGRTAALLQRSLSPPQQTADAEGGLVQEALRIFQTLHFARQKFKSSLGARRWEQSAAAKPPRRADSK